MQIWVAEHVLQSTNLDSPRPVPSRFPSSRFLSQLLFCILAWRVNVNPHQPLCSVVTSLTSLTCQLHVQLQVSYLLTVPTTLPT